MLIAASLARWRRGLPVDSAREDRVFLDEGFNHCAEFDPVDLEAQEAHTKDQWRATDHQLQIPIEPREV